MKWNAYVFHKQYEDPHVIVTHEGHIGGTQKEVTVNLAVEGSLRSTGKKEVTANLGEPIGDARNMHSRKRNVHSKGQEFMPWMPPNAGN
ncbi:Hypothetical predicted protein [Pelobates cultripes]|uniref:Uncharacterized protein n=1 Tax=Pelobates cultripes TaxID=61616 RepID=A0AAD1SLW3_PELCU|nr:Hypothetical predicted protein [Pelobates cultripes]